MEEKTEMKINAVFCCLGVCAYKAIFVMSTFILVGLN